MFSSQNPDDEIEEDNPYTITEEMLRERQKNKSSGKFSRQFYAAFLGIYI